MADYHVGLDGTVTRNKKKKKQADYHVSLDGTVTKNNTDANEQLSGLSQEVARKQATQSVTETVGTFEEYAAKMRSKNPNLYSKMADKGESHLKQSYQKIIEAKENSLSGTKDFSGLTNVYYQEYLENLKANATEQKQLDWLNEQYDNLVALQNPEIRQSIEKMYHNDNLLGYGEYSEGKKTLEKLGYASGQIENLLDTYKRESNAKSNANMKKRAEDLSDTTAGSIFAQFLSHGAKITSALGVLDNAVATVKEWWLDEYEPTDTNSYLYTSGDFADKARQEIEKNITKEDEYIKKGEDVPLLNKVAGMVYQAGTSVADSILHGGLGGAGMALMGAEAATSTSKDVFERTGSNEKALATGAISGGIEAVTEKFSLDHLWDIAKSTGKAFTRKAFANLIAQSGIEASEEIASEGLNTLVDKWINGKDSNYELNVQNYMEQGMSEEEARDKAFVDTWKQIGKAGASGAMAGVLGGGIATGFNKVSNKLSNSDKKVVDAEVQNRISEKETDGKKVTSKEKKEIEEQVRKDLEKGYISTDTIESVLGGKTYEEYKTYTDKKEALEKEIETFKKMPMSEFTVADSERLQEVRSELEELKKTTDEKQLKQRLSNEVQALSQGNYIGESYNEKGRRSQAYQADVGTYDKKMQATVQKAIDSGILNDTNRTHELVDFLAKISADKGVSFDFTNSENIKNTGFALEGKVVNGYVKDGNVTLNVNSAKALNKVVGHEITHVLEGSDLYAELQNAVKEYATTKGEYNSKLEALTKLYEGVEGANVEQELTADLIGDYLFTDEAFVKQLSSKNRNIFQKIYDEIKYLVKTVTSGSKEAKQLEKVKKLFDEVYREPLKLETKGIQYSIEELNDRRKYVDVNTDQMLFDGLDESNKRAMAKLVIQEYFPTGTPIELDGDTFYVSNRTAKEYAYAEKNRGKKRLQQDKMRASTELDNLVKASNFIENDSSQAVKERHPEAIGGIDTYETIFKVQDRWYKGTVNIINRAEGREIYDVTKIKSIGANEILNNENELAAQPDASINSISEIKQNTTEKQKFSLGSDDVLPTGDWNIKGEDVALDFPIAKEFTPAQNKEMQQSTVNEGSNVPDEWYIPVSNDLSVGPFSPPKGWEAGKTNKQKKATVEAEQTIKGRNAIKLERYQKQLEDIQTYRDKRISKNEELWTKREVEKKQIEKSFDTKIAQKQKEYDAKRNKDTKEANRLLSQIHNLEAKRNERITECERDIEHYMNEIGYVREESDRKITDLQEKIQKMNSVEFKTAEQRQTKQTEYRTLMSDLMGDTTTWRDKELGISYQMNTLRRILRDIVRDADGNRDIARADAIYDELQGKYNHNEALLNREINKIKQAYADMKINKVEDVYIQMLGEYKYNPDTTLSAEVMREYYEKHKEKIDKEKVDKAIELARKTYDSLLYRVNSVLREQGFKEIGYREGYFPHFTEEKQSKLAKIFNWKTKDDSIPTDIAGLTEQFNPERSYQSFNKHRTSDDTDYSFLKGMDTYIRGALDWIYHIEDIQKRRAFENEIRYRHSEQGIKNKLDEIYKNEEYDADEIQEQIDMVLKEAKNPLNNFVTDFRNATNNLAGKKDSTDRSLEYDTSRKIYSTMTNLSNRISANMVAGSVSSALTNFIPITHSWGQVSPISSLKAMKDTIKSIAKDDGTVNKSDFLTNRLRTTENLYKTGWDKAGEAVGFLMEAVDNFTSQTVWRSKYMENVQNGMSEAEAIKNADQFAENVIAGRSRGNMPTIFNKKNPVTKVLTAFQLEVVNQYGYMFKDMPQDMRNESKLKLVKGYVTMYVGAYAYNALYSTLVGRDAAFDPIGIIEELLRDLGAFGEDDKEDPLNALVNFATNIAEEIPFIGGLMGGGRIPISSALPYDGISIDSFSEMMSDVSEGNWKKIGMEWLNPVYYLVAPMGGGQAKKTIQGLSMFDDDLPIAGSYTDSGKLRFSVEDNVQNRVQAAVFGQYASENARDYFDQERSPLAEKQTQEYAELYKDSGMSIQEYWTIRDNLKELDNFNDKATYIAGLDIPDSSKNILVNNATARESEIDLSGYNSSFGDFEEFDYSVNNPGKYAVSKSVGGYATYMKYTNVLSGIKSNKDTNGETISGSRKEKIINYINGLSMDYGQKLILFKNEYPSDSRYNREIVEYLNNRNDISADDMETILKELGFTVDNDGTVRW